MKSRSQDVLPDMKILKKEDKIQYREPSTFEKLFCFLRREKQNEFDRSSEIIRQFHLRRLMDSRFWCLFGCLMNIIGLIFIKSVSEGMILFKKIYWAGILIILLMILYSYKNIKIIYITTIILQIRSMWPMFDMEGR
mgnify:CR=1 FL=1